MQKEDKFGPELIWREFHNKYVIPTSSETKNHKYLYSKKLTLEENKLYHQKIADKAQQHGKSLDKSALVIQKFWKNKTSQDTLIQVNLKGNHSEEFNELVHKQKVKKSLNAHKISELLTAIQSGSWGESIFLNEQLPY